MGGISHAHFNMNYKLIMLPNPILATNNPPYKEGDTFITKDGDIHKNYGYNYGDLKIIAGIEGLPKLDLSAIAKRIGWGGIWALGNKISVTTLYDYEERKEFPNHNEYENFGKRTYIGEVIEVDKGLALKTDDGKVFKTQGTYWFGSVLHQDCKLLEVNQSLNEKKYTNEDMLVIRNRIVSMLPVGEVNAWDMIKAVKEFTNWLDEYVESLSKPKEYNVLVDMEDKIAMDGHTLIGREPKTNNNTIKVTKILS